MVESTALEMRRTGNRTVGSNPTLSATQQANSSPKKEDPGGCAGAAHTIRRGRTSVHWLFWAWASPTTADAVKSAELVTRLLIDSAAQGLMSAFHPLRTLRVANLVAV